MHRVNLFGSLILVALLVAGCSGEGPMTGPEPAVTAEVATSGSATLTASGNGRGATTANGWYEEEEIYYIDNGEEGVTSRGENDIYLIGGDRLHQAQVVEFIPGEAGYSPHWNVNIVHTAEGVTVNDIVGSDYASDHFPEALFDDVEDILGARDDGLVTIMKPGKVVHCPIIPEVGAEAPGHTELPEVFEPFGDTF